MANVIYKSLAVQGLGTTTFVAPEAGIYFLRGKITIPTITNGGGQSALLVVINKNGSPVYTGFAGAQGFETNVSCAASDSITIVLSSSAAPDLALNAIKSVMTISEGA